jgi:hypothetical protein
MCTHECAEYRQRDFEADPSVVRDVEQVCSNKSDDRILRIDAARLDVELSHGLSSRG